VLFDGLVVGGGDSLFSLKDGILSDKVGQTHFKQYIEENKSIKSDIGAYQVKFKEVQYSGGKQHFMELREEYYQGITKTTIMDKEMICNKMTIYVADAEITDTSYSSRRNDTTRFYKRDKASGSWYYYDINDSDYFSFPEEFGAESAHEVLINSSYLFQYRNGKYIAMGNKIYSLLYGGNLGAGQSFQITLAFKNAKLIQVSTYGREEIDGKLTFETLFVQDISYDETKIVTIPQDVINNARAK
jgi:hypothetical protein